jgi:protein-S-isoprenylcysteine O-methyltransferase Ste14
MAHPAGRAASRENQDNLKDKSTAGQSLALAPSAFCASRLRSLGDRNGPEKTKTMTQPQAISQDSDSPVGRFIALFYGLAAYAAFFVTILYAIGFVSGLAVQKATIDTGTVVPIAEALIVNLLLMSVFAVQHSVMARKQFKQWWTQFVPKSVERSTYVLFSSLALMLLFWQWRPIPAVVWHVDNSQLALAVTGLSLVGWLTVFTSTFLINHFELFGVHQVANNLTGRQMPVPRFRTPFYYKFVRHPIYLGFIIAAIRSGCRCWCLGASRRDRSSGSIGWRHRTRTGAAVIPPMRDRLAETAPRRAAMR